MKLTDRENWLLQEVSSIGRLKIDTFQYEELRLLARKFRQQIEQLTSKDSNMKNIDLAAMAQSDPTRLKQRTVAPKKGKGKKKRTRKSNRLKREAGQS